MTCSATDGAGNTGSGAFQVTVVDADGPSLRRGIPDRYTLTPAGAKPPQAGLQQGVR